ncbi:MAG: cation-binding protein [Proteobacteria bacterium]|nr:cation-binding protein [Pseudomonadota bacterium]NOG59940.1 cation-binding protein [Pseudomonadota bacterium]
MQVTDELMNEHQLILKYIDLMEQYIKFSYENNDEGNMLLEKAQDFIDFIKKFADNYHHAKEEDVLFKHLQTPGVLSHCNPLPVMFSEHDQSRIFLKNMTEAVATSNRESFCENALNYGQLLQQHIMKENNILYPMAEEGLSDENKVALEKEYKQIEEKLNKSELWNKYEEKYTELKNCLDSKSVLVV